MTTFADLKTRIADEMDRNDINTQIGNEIKRAIKHYEQQRFWFNEAQTTITTSSSQASYSLPSNLIVIDNAEIQLSSNKLEVRPISWDKYVQDCFSLVWGILGGSMPRSGGEYIYNSRIIHPMIGIAESFGNAFVWIMWIYVLAPWTIDPGLVMMFQFMGMPAAAEFLTTPLAIFLVSSVVSFIALLFVVFGMKIFAKIQKIVMALGILGILVILLVFTFTSHDAFVQSWNTLAAQYGSLDYNGFLAAVKSAAVDAGDVIPTTWNWFDTLGVMVAGSWLFAYSYCITFIANLPTSVRTFLQTFSQRRNAIEALRAQLAADRVAAQEAGNRWLFTTSGYATVRAGTSGVYVDNEDTRLARMLELQRRVDTEARQLAALEAEHALAVEKAGESLTVLAMFTGKSYAKLEVWDTGLRR